MITGVNLLHLHLSVNIAMIQEVNVRVLYLRQHQKRNFIFCSRSVFSLRFIATNNYSLMGCLSITELCWASLGEGRQYKQLHHTVKLFWIKVGYT